MSAVYARVDGDEEWDAKAVSDRKSHPFCKEIVLFLLSLAVFTTGIIVGYFAHGPQHQSKCFDTTKTALSSTFRSTTSSFSYNHSFAEAPSTETNKLWESIFPPHGGFFHDPVIAPHGASLAVYHQLHCVDAIRQAYFLLYDAVIEGINVNFSNVEDYQTDWHTRHCIDFLRQMLMCNADLTVEHVNPSLGGITGLDGEHICIVWDDVLAWSVAQQENRPLAHRHVYR